MITDGDWVIAIFNIFHQLFAIFQINGDDPTQIIFLTFTNAMFISQLNVVHFRYRGANSDRQTLRQTEPYQTKK